MASSFLIAAAIATLVAALDKTALAMFIMRVNDLAKCRSMCAAAGELIEVLGHAEVAFHGGQHDDNTPQFRSNEPWIGAPRGHRPRR